VTLASLTRVIDDTSQDKGYQNIHITGVTYDRQIYFYSTGNCLFKSVNHTTDQD
jgi:hypothetical protein